MAPDDPEPAGPGALRSAPRQRRSAARIDTILGAAEEIFEEVGFERATTALVATRADVPIGTLYRWFPDKGALALALCDRYLDDIEVLYDQLLSTDEEEPVRVLVRRVLDRLEAFATERKALSAIAATVSGTTGDRSAGQRLRTALAGHVALLVELRVPGIDDEARDEVVDAVVTVVNAFLVRAGELAPDQRPPLFHQLGDIVLAYVEAKFPAEGSPAWDDPERSVEPLRPGIVMTGWAASAEAAEAGGPSDPTG